MQEYLYSTIILLLNVNTFVVEYLKNAHVRSSSDPSPFPCTQCLGIRRDPTPIPPCVRTLWMTPKTTRHVFAKEKKKNVLFVENNVYSIMMREMNMFEMSPLALSAVPTFTYSSFGRRNKYFAQNNIQTPVIKLLFKHCLNKINDK